MTSADPQGASSRAIESLLAFWAEAGVSVSASDTAIDRLAAPPPRAAAPAPKGPPAPPPLAKPSLRRAQSSGDAVEQARAAAAAAGDFAALQEAIAAFEGCALRHSGAARAVIVRGDPATADVLVIGEAPTAADEASGLPFQGAQGRLLDRMLELSGLAQRSLLLNTVFWRTPGDSAPASADQAACAPFLERAAALMKPKAVLVLGAAAARSVLATSEPILKLRGRWRPWIGAHEPLDLPTLASFSPAFLLAQPAARRQAWGDLLTLAERVDPNPASP